MERRHCHITFELCSFSLLNYAMIHCNLNKCEAFQTQMYLLIHLLIHAEQIVLCLIHGVVLHT